MWIEWKNGSFILSSKDYMVLNVANASAIVISVRSLIVLLIVLLIPEGGGIREPEYIIFVHCFSCVVTAESQTIHPSQTNTPAQKLTSLRWTSIL